MPVSPDDAYVVVTVNGTTGLYRYQQNGRRSQSLEFIASIADLVDVYRLNEGVDTT